MRLVRSLDCLLLIFLHYLVTIDFLCVCFSFVGSSSYDSRSRSSSPSLVTARCGSPHRSRSPTSLPVLRRRSSSFSEGSLRSGLEQPIVLPPRTPVVFRRALRSTVSVCGLPSFLRRALLLLSGSDVLWCAIVGV